MFIQVSFALLLLSLRVVASPVVIRDSPVTIPFARRFNTTGTANLLKLEQARARTLKNRSRTPPVGLQGDTLPPNVAYSIPASNQIVNYAVDVGVGNPPTQYSLLVDTGSSNTWLGADKKYVQSQTSIDTLNSIYVEYGSGVVLGEEWLDQVTLGSGLTLANQSIGVALIAIGFDGVDGILGIGPQDLTLNSLFPDATATVPTVTDNAFAQGLIDAEMVGISFQPTSSGDPVTNGELMFGGIDSSKFTGDLTYVPITSTQPATTYVGIDQSITYGPNSIPILSETAGIADTGTTLFLLASDAIASYQNATGAQLDSNVGLLKMTPDQFSSLQSLYVTIGGRTFELTATAQAWPRALNSALGGTDDVIYLIVADIGYNSGVGLDFINGMTFLERFYTVYDAGKKQFGIATTPFTFATS